MRSKEGIEIKGRTGNFEVLAETESQPLMGQVVLEILIS